VVESRHASASVILESRSSHHRRRRRARGSPHESAANEIRCSNDCRFRDLKSVTAVGFASLPQPASQ
jgi:hypothetical protein